MEEFELIETAEGLSALREDWTRLLDATPRASFFQSHEWFFQRWRHRLATDDALKVIVHREGGKASGIIPLVVQERPLPLGTVRKLRFPIDNWGSFHGPISADPAKTLEAGGRFLKEREKSGVRDFDLVEFTNLASAQEGAEIFPDPRETWEVSECSHVAVLEIEGTWEDYWESRRAQKNRRRNVERCERRLAETGEIGWIRYRPATGGDPRWDLYDACEELASRSWQDGLVDGHTLHHSEVRSFLRDLHEGACHAGGCDLSLLTVDGKPAAFCYGYHHRGYVDLMRVGFDPRFAKLAPGNALWTRLIRDSFERGDQVLDFGPSCLDYKSFWMTGIATSYQAVRYAPTFAARAFRVARMVRHHLPKRGSADHTNQEAKDLAARQAAGA